jgi:hypothetical protein
MGSVLPKQHIATTLTLPILQAQLFFDELERVKGIEPSS